jgi:hypothetical protein
MNSRFFPKLQSRVLAPKRQLISTEDAAGRSRGLAGRVINIGNNGTN